MERLFAPWRLSYITENKPAADATRPDCIFCHKPTQTGEENDAENFIVYRGPTCFVILNAYPYNNGHLMVLPYRHIARPAEMTPDECAEMMMTTANLTTVLDEVYRANGYNIGINVGSAAGAGIAAHLHLHIVPRWNGDTNFMPVIGEVKVLPETLEQTYRKVRGAIEARESAGKAS
ncbi:MAG: HIT domain-containing protein [Capsulimonadales bacterium]|nr:HIT domain-containing protein [Capsulimonadales bacterium]